VLFVAREPLGLRKLAQLANLTDGTEVRTLIGELRSALDQRGCAFQVEQVAAGYQLRTRPQFAPWLRPLAAAEAEIRLSAPALETLAVVAYRQPVLRAEVESIRGVGCGEILRLLMDRDLLRIVGRSDELGRPLWYGTTKRFLEAFGLSHLDELPWAAQLRRQNSTDQPIRDASHVARESLSAGLADDCLTSDVDAA
jgi:segregation and condensation protein B